MSVLLLLLCGRELLSSADVVEGKADIEDLGEPAIIVAIRSLLLKDAEATYLSIVALVTR